MSRLADYLDKHLVPEWRRAWKWSSVQFAAVVSAAVTAFAANPGLMFQVLNYMPADPTQRGLAAAGIGLIAFFGPTLLRLWNQAKEQADG